MQTWLTTWLNILQVRKFAAIDKHPGKSRDGGRGGGGGELQNKWQLNSPQTETDPGIINSHCACDI